MSRSLESRQPKMVNNIQTQSLNVCQMTLDPDLDHQKNKTLHPDVSSHNSTMQVREQQPPRIDST